jgi:lipoprotein-anchoring transpeptidase ErfK/SrfK
VLPLSIASRTLTASALALAIAAPSAVAAEPAASSAPSRRTVSLARSHVAYPTPRVRAGRGRRVAALRPITRARTVLPVLGAADDAAGHHWLRVLLPGRPNGATGWISARGTTEAVTPWAIEVDLSRRRTTVRYEDRVVRRFGVAIGTRATPTPRGRFFVEETVRLPGGQAAGPFALATSARSEVLQEFDGGPGQIALHGRDGIGGRIGTAVSHGCVRVSDRDVRWLAERIGPGVRVTIHG